MRRKNEAFPGNHKRFSPNLLVESGAPGGNGDNT